MRASTDLRYPMAECAIDEPQHVTTSLDVDADAERVRRRARRAARTLDAIHVHAGRATEGLLDGEPTDRVQAHLLEIQRLASVQAAALRKRP